MKFSGQISLTILQKSLFLFLIFAVSATGVLVLSVVTNPKHTSPKNIFEVSASENQTNGFSITATISAKSIPPKPPVPKTSITLKGDQLLVLINKTIRLPPGYEPGDLVTIDAAIPTTKAGMRLRTEANQSLKELVVAAQTVSVNPIVLSSYRSYWEQQNTFSAWVASAGLAAAETFSARPGHSQHQLGTTVDFTSNDINKALGDTFSTTKESAWLVENAYKFGFVLAYPKGKEAITGYTYEPWHYRYIGKTNAQKMIDSGLILEEFLQKFGVW